eukprot:IDg4062t1
MRSSYIRNVRKVIPRHVCDIYREGLHELQAPDCFRSSPRLNRLVNLSWRRPARTVGGCGKLAALFGRESVLYVLQQSELNWGNPEALKKMSVLLVGACKPKHWELIPSTSWARFGGQRGKNSEIWPEIGAAHRPDAARAATRYCRGIHISIADAALYSSEAAPQVRSRRAARAICAVLWRGVRRSRASW